MKISLLIILLVAVLFLKQSHQAAVGSGLVKVSIYYESNCSDTIRFITRQLYPTYQQMGSSLLIDFIPFGKATQFFNNGAIEFNCQHGPEECWGNKAHACGLAENKGQDKNVEYVNCLLSQEFPAKVGAVDTCASKLEVPAATIIECANGPKGDALLSMHGYRTYAHPITDIPAIAFNDNFNPNIQYNAWNQFLDTACRFLINKPSVCPAIPPPSVVTTPYPCCGNSFCNYCCC